MSLAPDDAIARIKTHVAEVVMVSAGVDAWKDDPISDFKLDSPDFLDCWQGIGRLGLPCVFCTEGGSVREKIGVKTANGLNGFASVWSTLLRPDEHGLAPRLCWTSDRVGVSDRMLPRGIRSEGGQIMPPQAGAG